MGLTQQAGGWGSVELSRGGNLFSRGGDPSSSYLHRGFLLGGQSGAGEVRLPNISNRAAYLVLAGRDSLAYGYFQILAILDM
ncbi:hypothetical protein JOQ06_026917 [Pogonophryne albipinna]|uniref:Uncharacterized protein n=1 Tax=Pogonophryne albipinna TaxID=1090488 RepID=A0AAD6BB16_9TELE|nr:hypothetical protein JOQ06_026917 [Pogonophryne albipinna]